MIAEYTDMYNVKRHRKSIEKPNSAENYTKTDSV